MYRRLLDVLTMQAFKAFSDGALWDSPPAGIDGRDVVRVAFYATKCGCRTG
jgi:hypothetical protein